MSPPNVPLWHAGYFELKLIKTQKTQEKFLVSPLTAQNNYIRGPTPGKELLPENSF